MNLKKYDLVIAGNYTKDTIVSQAGTRYVDGGGFNYGAHAAAMMGMNVAAVTRLAKSDFYVVENLRAIGVDVFPLATPSSTLMRLEYPTANVDERILTVSATAGSFTAEQFDDLEASAFLINASIRGEVPIAVLASLRTKDTILVADLQGFIRTLDSQGRLENTPWPEKEEALALLDVVKTDAVEAESITGQSDIHKAAKILAEHGPGEIVLTHRDGILVYTDGRYYEAPFKPKQLVGRSGRGDTCISAYMSKRLSEPPEISIIWAAAVTSLKMEAEGPFLGRLSEIEELIRREYSGKLSVS